MSQVNENKSTNLIAEDKKKDVLQKEKNKRSNEKRRSKFKESQELFTRASVVKKI